MRRRFTATAVAGALVAGLITAPAARAAGLAAPGDFNGDGKIDLVAGAPGAGISGWQSGAVAVLKGSGLPGITITQDTGIPGTAEDYENFGGPLASGDFDADGFADLAVGTPNEGVDLDGDGIEESAAGSVTVVYGSRRGLDTKRSQLFTQASPGIPGEPGIADRFGASLAAGDFNGDGRDDLAVGAPNDQDDRSWSGSIAVLSGGRKGLSGVNARQLTNEVMAYEFGWRLAAGDVNGDGVADLVLVADMGGGPPRVIGYPGGSAGLDAAASFTKDVPGFSTQFGSVAVGDINGDHKADVAVGDPQYSSGGGQVAVILSRGETLADPQVINQDTPGVPDSDESGDRFGWSLAIGDVNRDGKGDLAIGAPSEDLEATDVRGAGAVTVLRGSTIGLSSEGAKWFSQDTDGIPGSAEDADLFGTAVSLHDHTGDGKADLVIGAEQKSIGDFPLAGQLTVLHGVSTTKAATVDFSQLGVVDPSFAGFGRALLP